jgi:hypothetical protein
MKWNWPVRIRVACQRGCRSVGHTSHIAVWRASELTIWKLIGSFNTRAFVVTYLVKLPPSRPMARNNFRLERHQLGIGDNRTTRQQDQACHISRETAGCFRSRESRR